MTLEKLAYESELGSKGHLSDLENGLARPNIHTLQVLADHLGLALLDLVTLPAHDQRQRLIDKTRKAPHGVLIAIDHALTSALLEKKTKTPAPGPRRRAPKRAASRQIRRA